MKSINILPSKAGYKEKNKRSERTRVFNASCELGDIAGIIEEFNGALSFEDIVDKLTIPQITIMRLDKPSVDLDEDEKNNKGSINSAEEFFIIHKQTKNVKYMAGLILPLNLDTSGFNKALNDAEKKIGSMTAFLNKKTSESVHITSKINRGNLNMLMRKQEHLLELHSN